MRATLWLVLALLLAGCATLGIPSPTPMYGPTPGSNYNPVDGSFNLGGN